MLSSRWTPCTSEPAKGGATRGHHVRRVKMWRGAREDLENGCAADAALLQLPEKMYDAQKNSPSPCWRGHGGATGAPQGLCLDHLEEPLVVRVSELSCRLWVFPFAHEALAVAGGGGGRIKKWVFVAKTSFSSCLILRHAKTVFERSDGLLRGYGHAGNTF